MTLQPAPVPDHAQHRPLAPLPQGPLRIVALGTSLTAGGGWTGPLAARLSACAGHAVEVIAVARGGADSGWGRAQRGRVAALSPDLVLVEFSINDADLRHGLTLARARANHMDLLADPGGAQVVPVIMSPAFGARGWLLRPWRADHEAQYRRMAAERGLGLIDLAPLWQKALSLAADPRTLMPDGLHPTPAAMAAVALPEMAARIAAAIPGCGQG